MFLITADKSILMLLRKAPRSKTYVMVCIGRKRHYRKDGSCPHTDAMLANIKPEVRSRVKIDPFGGPARRARMRPEQVGRRPL